jgi:hypothetical protein
VRSVSDAEMRPHIKAIRTYIRNAFPVKEKGVWLKAVDQGCQAGQDSANVEKSVDEVSPRQQDDCGSHQLPLQYPLVSQK